MEENNNSNKYKYLITALICTAVVLAVGICVIVLSADLEPAYAQNSNEASLEETLSDAASDETETTQAATETECQAVGSLSLEEISSTSSVYIEDGTTYVVKNIDTIETELTDGQDSGNSNYVIYVNLAWNVVTVCSTDDSGTETPVRAFYCSAALDGVTTPTGEFELDQWYEWCSLMDGSYGHYAYRLTGDEEVTHILFHSVPYLSMSEDTLEWEEYNKLGTNASMGCIRVSASDARWLCENAGSGSKVVIYSDESSAGPINAVSTCFIPEVVTQICGWDPTDPSADNPWLSYTFTLETPDEITVSAGDKLDITALVSATDIYGNDISAYASYTCDGSSVDGSVAFYEVGVHTLAVSVSAGLVTAGRTITVTVTE